jgi:hypothetical protein
VREQLQPTFDLKGLPDPVRALLEDSDIAGPAATSVLVKLIAGSTELREADDPQFTKLLMLALADPALVEMAPELRHELEEITVAQRAIYAGILLVSLHRDRINLQALANGPQPVSI